MRSACQWEGLFSPGSAEPIGSSGLSPDGVVENLWKDGVAW
ncbi:hypothetical protein SynBMKMC1_02417 [Synechococcus sp. BMK-MC-1]|nr:hypothetical protein SynBMKMC1_02417 [Synechococcus sp. BMK-MC-1]